VQACPGHLVCGSATTCLAACSSNIDCVAGFQCVGGTCVPVAV
jgi:hypothetical protein